MTELMHMYHIENLMKEKIRYKNPDNPSTIDGH